MPSLPISLYKFTIGKIQYRSTQFKCVNWNNKLIFDVIIKLQFSLKLSFYEYVRFGRTLSAHIFLLFIMKNKKNKERKICLCRQFMPGSVSQLSLRL
jgi:hypothetical protein